MTADAAAPALGQVRLVEFPDGERRRCHVVTGADLQQALGRCRQSVVRLRASGALPAPECFVVRRGRGRREGAYSPETARQAVAAAAQLRGAGPRLHLCEQE